MSNRKITLKYSSFPFNEYWVRAKPIYGGRVTFLIDNLGHRYDRLHMPPNFSGCTRISCDPMCAVKNP
jgi:hypothetical protein